MTEPVLLPGKVKDRAGQDDPAWGDFGDRHAEGRHDALAGEAVPQLAFHHPGYCHFPFLPLGIGIGMGRATCPVKIASAPGPISAQKAGSSALRPPV